MLRVSFVAPCACGVGTGSDSEPRRRGRPRKAAAGKKRPRVRQIEAPPDGTGRTAGDAPAGSSVSNVESNMDSYAGDLGMEKLETETATKPTKKGSTQAAVNIGGRASRKVSKKAPLSSGDVSGAKPRKGAAKGREFEGSERPSGKATRTKSVKASGLVTSESESKRRAHDPDEALRKVIPVTEAESPGPSAVHSKAGIEKEGEMNHFTRAAGFSRRGEKRSKQGSKAPSKLRTKPTAETARNVDSSQFLPYLNSNYDGVRVEAAQGANAESERDAMKRMVSAKNGMTGDDEPPDFMDELMLLFAAREVQAKADSVRLPSDPDPVREMRELAAGLANQHASLFRYSGSTEQLLPFQLRSAGTAPCGMCAGNGLRPCTYCGGAGSVPDTVCGPPGSFVVDANGRRAIVPESDDLLDEYICAFCNGGAKEECDACDGSGKIDLPGTVRGEERSGTGRAGAADESFGKAATEEPSQAEFIRKHADRIEIGADGTVILRAKSRKKKLKAKDATRGTAASSMLDGDAPGNPPPSPGAKRRRGRPRKGEEMDVLYPLKAPMPVGGTRTGLPRGPVGRSTDFVNTDYQVLRESRGAGFRRNTAAFSAALTRRLGKDGESHSVDAEGDKAEGGKPKSGKPEGGKPDIGDSSSAEVATKDDGSEGYVGLE